MIQLQDIYMARNAEASMRNTKHKTMKKYT